MLKKNERIKKSELISLVLSKGKSVRFDGFTIKLLPSKSKESFFTVVVPKKFFSRVVFKNRYKRRGMALLRTCKEFLKSPYLVVLIPSKDFLEIDFEKLEHSLQKVFKEISK